MLKIGNNHNTKHVLFYDIVNLHKTEEIYMLLFKVSYFCVLDPPWVEHKTPSHF